jgi:hypothetical protein
MTKYSKHNNDAKKIKQASKDYGTKSRSNIKENINQMSSSDSGKDSNVRYDETTDPSSQRKSSEISDLSLFNNSRRTEIKQSETSTLTNSPNEKSEELKPLVVYDIASKDGITEADTSITTKKSVTILPYDDNDVMTSNPFHAAISLWQNYTSAWLRVWNEFFRYPTAITGEIGFFRLAAYLCKEKSAQDHKFRAMGELAFQSIVHTS